MRHIVLIGLSGSGKSTLGSLAASELGMRFVDLDTEVESLVGMPIRKIFARHGEKFFRDAETRMTLEAAASATPSVIAAGGGVVLRRENVRALRENGFVIFLDRPVEQIIRDIPRDGLRPLVTGAEALYEMERDRRALYIASCDFALSNAAGVDEALLRLIGSLHAGLAGRFAETHTGYAVIGDPIAHTLSPAIHRAVFDAVGVDETYAAMRVSREELPCFARKSRISGLKGFNVTIPHKRDIIPFLDAVEDEASLCGAVNTVIVRDGRLFGFNTDMGGLLASLREDGWGYRDMRVLILGAGGACRGAALKAAREGASEIVILSRRPEKAREIASLTGEAQPCSISAGIMSPGAMADAAAKADILINTTPLGMSGIGEDFQSFEFLRALPRRAIVCDLVYNPPETSLLREAASLGLVTRNGLGMLIYQALLANELFLGRDLNKPALYKIIKERLAK